MTIEVRDPLALLPYQSGMVVTPLEEGAASASTRLDTEQLAVRIGDVVPIVFGRRVTINSVEIGGVFVSPAATEGRYENDGTTNELTVNLELVLSEGELPALELRDVFQRACRVGTWVQTYDRRAGSFTAGNFITAVSGTEFWNCPYYCGTSGTYDNMTTLAYQNSHADGDQTWSRQVHCFVREGMQVTRILDDTYGPSNNLIDLALYLIRQSSRFPETMLDLVQFEAAANFTDTNGFFYNGIINYSTNLEDWLQRMAKGFMLRISDKNGQKGFRPALPVNADHTINTSRIEWVWDFSEEHLLPDGFEIEYIPLADRLPIRAEMLWRQQPDDDIGIIRTAIVGFDGEAVDGPFEQYDLSEFCTSEDHAVKIGTFYVARRKYISHTLRIRVKPDAYNSTLELGDIVRVILRRETDVDQVSHHNYLYEVERINKTISGVVELDLIHFPIDSQGRSLVALAVNGATGAGYTLATGRTDFNCDDGDRRTDTTALSDVGGNLPDLPASTDFTSLQIPATADSPSGSSNDGEGNPADPFEGPLPGPSISGGSGPNGQPLPGDEMSAGQNCSGQYNEWWLCPSDSGINDQCVMVSSGVAATYIVDSDAKGKYVFVRGRCPDPGEPSGYGPGSDSEPTLPVPPEFTGCTGSFKEYRVGGTTRQVYGQPGGQRPNQSTYTDCDTGEEFLWTWNDSTTNHDGIEQPFYIAEDAYGIRAWTANASYTYACEGESTFASKTILFYQLMNAQGEWGDVIEDATANDGVRVVGYIPSPNLYFDRIQGLYCE